jgi:hypothetical protein
MLEFLFSLLGIAALFIYVAIAAGLGFLVLPPVVRFIGRNVDDPVGTWIAIGAYFAYVIVAYSLANEIFGLDGSVDPDYDPWLERFR